MYVCIKLLTILFPTQVWAIVNYPIFQNMITFVICVNIVIMATDNYNITET